MRSLPRSLRHRDFALLWGGQSVSVLGDGIYTIAIALEALRISNHASTLAYVEAARVLPNALLLLIAGALVDRLPRRLVVLGSDLLRGLAVAAVAVMVATHTLGLPALILLSAAVGIGDAFFYPSYRAIMPELLSDELLTQGNAVNSASQTIGSAFAGPMLGGVLVAFGGASAAFGVDAATFAVSGVCLLMMSRVDAPPTSGNSLVHDAREGLRWTRRQRWLWYGIIASGIANFAAFSPLAVTVPLIVRNTLHQSAATYGITIGMFGIGGLVAAAVAGRFGSPPHRVAVIWGTWALASLVMFGIGGAPDVVVVAICGAILFFTLSYGNLLWGTLMQDSVPGEMLGRASSVDWLFSICLSPLGIIFAGVLAGSVGTRLAIVIGAAVSLLSCLVVFVPGVTDPDRPGYQPVPLERANPGERAADAEASQRDSVT